MLTITETWSKKKAVVVTCAVICSLIVMVVVGIYLNGRVKAPAPVLAEGGTAATSRSKLGRYRVAAVCADAGICSSIGRTMLERGGNAVDSAVATLLCDGVVNPQSMGIGGGFFMTLYNHSTGLVETLIARETAPAAAQRDMFQHKDQSQTGGLSVGVPGEVPGYWAVHQRYGRLPWSALFQPAISLCRYGTRISPTVRHALETARVRTILLNDTFGLGDLYLKKGNETVQVGDLVRRPALAATLEKIAEGGLQAYHQLGQKLAQDIQEIGGIVTYDDIRNYTPTWEAPVRVRLPVSGLTVYSVPPPASGPVIAMILGTLDGLRLSQASLADNEAQVHMLHTIAETFKFAYAQRSLLGDAAFVDVEEVVRNMTSPEFLAEVRRLIRSDGTLGGPAQYGAQFANTNDSGTVHVSVVDADGNAVAVTSTINLYFGSGFISPQTGIILNDEMDDFSSNFTNSFGLPPSEANYIEPGKRPQSSMVPTIVVEDGKGVRLVIGAAGGAKITAVTAYTAARYLWMGENIKQAIDARRIHHQLLPDELYFEEGVPKTYIQQLKTRGHPVKQGGPLARVCGIGRAADGSLEANSDYRKGGDVAGY